jgi:hypothetical protein
MMWLELVAERRNKARKGTDRVTPYPTPDPLMRKLELIRAALGMSKEYFAKDHLGCSLEEYARWLRQGAPEATSEQYQKLAEKAKALEHKVAWNVVRGYLEKTRTHLPTPADFAWGDFRYSFEDYVQFHEDPSRPHCILFTYKVHKGLGGDCPPLVAETVREAHWPLYIYDVQRDTLEQAGEAREPQREFDPASFVGERIGLKWSEDGTILVSWGFWDERAVPVHSLDEVRQVARQRFSEFNWREVAEYLVAGASEEEIEALARELSEVVTQYAERELENEWPQTIEDETPE